MVRSCSRERRDAGSISTARAETSPKDISADERVSSNAPNDRQTASTIIGVVVSSQLMPMRRLPSSPVILRRLIRFRWRAEGYLPGDHPHRW